MHELRMSGGDDEVHRLFSAALFQQYILRVSLVLKLLLDNALCDHVCSFLPATRCQTKVKMETVNDEPRLKCTIMKADKVDYLSECAQLIEAIGKYA